jgi:hypothetical protein
MGRVSKILTSRITLAVVGVLLVGGAGGVWAMTNGSPAARQAANSLSNTGAEATSAPGSQDPTATPMIDATPTATKGHPTPVPTPRPTATPCPPSGQSVQWLGFVASVSLGTSSFVLRVGCARPTIVANGATLWPGVAKTLADLHSGWHATVLATRQPDATYLASSVTAQPPVGN